MNKHICKVLPPDKPYPEWAMYRFSVYSYMIHNTNNGRYYSKRDNENNWVADTGTINIQQDIFEFVQFMTHEEVLLELL